MIVANKNGIGNPNHDEEGKFTTAENGGVASFVEEFIGKVKEQDGLEQKVLDTLDVDNLDAVKEVLDKMKPQMIRQFAKVFDIELTNDDDEAGLSKNFNERLEMARNNYSYFKVHNNLEDYIDVESVNKIEDKKATLINAYHLDKNKIEKLDDDQIDSVFKSLYLIAFKQNARLLKSNQKDLASDKIDIKYAQSIISELMSDRYVYSKYAKNTAVHIDISGFQASATQNLVDKFWYEQKNKMTHQEYNILMAYTGEGYSWINKALYGGDFYNGYGPEMYKNNPKEFAYVVNSMTNALNKCKLPFSIWVTRGQDDTGELFGIDNAMDKTTFRKAYEQYGDALIGSSFKLENFVSTSGSKNSHFSGGLIFNFYCPKGTNMAYVGSDSSYSGENEFILQRGYSYRITKIESQGYFYYIDADVILDSNKDMDNSLEGLEKIKKENLDKYGYTPSTATKYTGNN